MLYHDVLKGVGAVLLLHLRDHEEVFPDSGAALLPIGVDQLPFRSTGYLSPQKEPRAQKRRAFRTLSAACEI